MTIINTPTDPLATLDRYEQDISNHRSTLRRLASESINIGKMMYEVQTRELFKLRGHDTYPQWLKARFGIQPDHAEEYTNIRLIPLPLVQDLAISLDRLNIVVSHPADLWPALCPAAAALSGDPGTKLLRRLAASAASLLEATGDLPRAEAHIQAVVAGKEKPLRSWRKPPRPPAPSDMGGKAQRQLRKVDDTLDELEVMKQQGKPMQGAWTDNLWKKVCAQQQRVADLLGRGGPESFGGDRRQTWRPEGPPRGSENPRGSADEIIKKNHGLDEKTGSAPAPVGQQGAVSPTTKTEAAPAQAETSAARAETSPPTQEAPRGAGAGAASAPAEEVVSVMAEAVHATLDDAEKAQVQKILVALLQGKEPNAVAFSLELLLTEIESRMPWLDLDLSLEWYQRLCAADFDKRWDFTLAFFLSAKLPGYSIDLHRLSVGRLSARMIRSITELVQRIPMADGEQERAELCRRMAAEEERAQQQGRGA